MTDAAQLATAAAALAGAPYRPGADGTDGVFNCWALVREVFRRCGTTLPADPVDAIRWHLCEPGAGEPGEVLLMHAVGTGARHVGLLLPRGRVFHGVEPCAQVTPLKELPMLGLVPMRPWKVL